MTYLTLALAPGQRVVIFCGSEKRNVNVIVLPTGEHVCSGCWRPVKVVT